jgi:hypothetical protein
VRPAEDTDDVTVIYEDASLDGRVAENIEDIPDPSTTNRLEMSPENGFALAYWAPKSSSDYARLYRTVTNGTYIYPQDVLINKENLISVETNPRTIPPGGLALVQEKELNIKVDNPLIETLWLEVNVDPFGSNGPVFDISHLVQQGLAFQGMHEQDTFYLLARPNRTTDFVLYPDEMSDGGSVKLYLFNPNAPWWPQATDPPMPPPGKTQQNKMDFTAHNFIGLSCPFALAIKGDGHLV